MQTTQNYLKTLFSLSLLSDDGIVKTRDIAKKLDVSPPAVTDMIKKLSKSGYVTNHRYKGVSLTESGADIGRNMVRHHRLWESFLNLELGLPWDKVHVEAERLEHACSDDLINKIEEKLGFPEFDPHGNPIPRRDGSIPELVPDIALPDGELGQAYRVTRVVDLTERFLVYLDDLGVKLGSVLTLVEVLDFDESILCEVNGHKFSLSLKAASQVFVKVSILK